MNNKKVLILIISIILFLVIMVAGYSNKDVLLQKGKNVVQKITGEDSTGSEKNTVKVDYSASEYSASKSLLSKIEDKRLKEYTEEELNAFREQLEKNRDDRLVWDLASPNRDIKFNKCYSKEFKDTNILLYQIVERYFTPINFEGMECDKYIDPLYIMAISNVEFGSLTTPNVLLAPAVPTARGVKVTKDNLMNFGYKEYMKYPAVLSMDRDGYRGPLQMYVTGLGKGIKPEDLVGSEYMLLLTVEDCDAKLAELNKLKYVEGSGIPSRLDGMTLKNRADNYGDRFNYADAVNRLSGFIKDNWSMYYSKSDSLINKEDEQSIDTKFAWMAMTSIGHNASPGIYYMNDKSNISQYYWWPYNSFGDVRKYCHQLGQKECTDYIKQKAREALSLARRGGGLKFILTRQEGMSIANDLVNGGYIDDNLWKCTIWNHQEKIAYPIQVLYNYFVLDEIYSGN